MKRYDFYQPGYGEPDYMDETPAGEYVKFEDAQALIDYHRGSCVTLTEKHSQLMDQYMELKGYLAEAESACDAWEIKNGDAPHRCIKLADRIRVSGGLLPAPSEAKGVMRPIERPLCQFGGNYGWCELEPGHDGPHKITRAGVLEAKRDTPDE